MKISHNYILNDKQILSLTSMIRDMEKLQKEEEEEEKIIV